MIRFLLLLAVFVLGLAGAAVWQGQMHHLRRALPQDLPGWTAAVADEAGLRRGAARLAGVGGGPWATLRWTARAPGPDGFLWDVQLVGKGFDLRAELVLPYWPDRIFLRGGNGTADLAQVSGQAVSGLVALKSVAVEMTDLTGARTLRGTFAAEARAVVVEGADLGGGPVDGRLEDDGKWRAAIALGGGVTAVDGQMTGALQTALARLDVTVADAAALPDRLRDGLAAVATPDGAGLRIALPIPVPLPAILP